MWVLFLILASIIISLIWFCSALLDRLALERLENERLRAQLFARHQERIRQLELAVDFEEDFSL